METKKDKQVLLVNDSSPIDDFLTGSDYRNAVIISSVNIHQQDRMFIEKGDDIFPEELLLSLYEGYQ